MQTSSSGRQRPGRGGIGNRLRILKLTRGCSMTTPSYPPAGAIPPLPTQGPAQAWPQGAPGGLLPFPPPDAAIATWGLTETFGQKIAVNALNLVVRKGE